MLATVVEAQRERWDTTTELLAGIIQAVDFGNRILWAANSKDPPPDPVVIHRPGDPAQAPEPEAPPPATVAEMKAFFGGGIHYTP